MSNWRFMKTVQLERSTNYFSIYMKFSKLYEDYINKYSKKATQPLRPDSKRKVKTA